MARERGYIEVEGLREFQRAVRRAADTDLPKRMGQAHKEVGLFIKRLVDRESDPSAVGEGSGSELRPSASKREVLLRVGGAHRAHENPDIVKARQWGKRVVRPFRRAPKRPYIKQIADDHRDEIGEMFLRKVSEAMDPAFYDTEP